MDDFTLDYENRINPKLATRLLADAVPVIKSTKFQFIEVKRGYCKSLLPLNRQSSNQHGTHQALLLALAGDYTGGLAFASIIDKEPVLGLNEITPEKGMSLWLIKSDMQYLKTSVDDVLIEAEISEDKHQLLSDRYHNGNTILINVDITFKNLRSEDIAKGTFHYYCRKKSKLKPKIKNRKLDIMYEHMIKTSAKLVSQLKYLESENENPLFTDKISQKVAGKQGEVIANRFVNEIPELQPLVAAKTYHLDTIINNYSNKVSQVVFIGIGLDFRILRQVNPFKGIAVYELELATQLSERNYFINALKLKFGHLKSLNQICCNVLLENIQESLIANGFDINEATLFVFEGSSTHYNKEENIKILREISELLSYNKQNILWMDFASSKALNSENKSDAIKQFMSGLAKLGEPLVSGFEAEDKIFETFGLSIIERSYPGDILRVNGNEIYSLFSYNLMHYKK